MRYSWLTLAEVGKKNLKIVLPLELTLSGWVAVSATQLEFHRHVNAQGKPQHQDDNEHSDTASQEKADIIQHIEHPRV